MRDQTYVIFRFQLIFQRVLLDGSPELLCLMLEPVYSFFVLHTGTVQSIVVLLLNVQQLLLQFYTVIFGVLPRLGALDVLLFLLLNLQLLFSYVSLSLLR